MLQVLDLRGDAVLTPFVGIPVVALFFFANAENVGTVCVRDLPDVFQQRGDEGRVGGVVGDLV